MNLTLQMLMRYLHIVAAVLAVGGLAFVAFCLRPAVERIDQGVGQPLESMVQQRFQRILWICIAILSFSGLYNWVLLNHTYQKMGWWAHALIGTKVLLAVVMFVVVWLRWAGWVKNARLATMINVHLAAVVILLGSILRVLRLDYIVSLIPPGLGGQ